MRTLRVCVLLVLVSTAVFAQRGGGGFRGGGFQGGGGFRGGGGFHGGYGGFRGGGFRSGMRPGVGFHHTRGFFRPGFRSSRFFGGFGGYGGFGIGPGFGYGVGTFGYPGYYDYNYYSYPRVISAIPPAYPYPYYESAPVVVTQNFGPPAPPPVYSRDYPPRAEEYREPIYLIAHKDHRIEAAIAYWVEGDTLHYVTRQREKKQIPLDEIDRAFTEQLNRDRRVDFQLPR